MSLVQDSPPRSRPSVQAGRDYARGFSEHKIIETCPRCHKPIELRPGVAWPIHLTPFGRCLEPSF